MRRDYATFRSLDHFFNCITSDAETNVVFVCLSRTAFTEEGAQSASTARQPTLNQLATASTSRLQFVPTIQHLRVALSTGLGFTFTDDIATEVDTIVLLNIMSLHSAGSAQQLSQTLALAVEAAEIADANLLLAECCSQTHGQSLSGDDTLTGSERWQEQLSILGSRSTLPSTRQPWAARTVTAEQVVSRWCKRREVKGDVSLLRA